MISNRFYEEAMRIMLIYGHAFEWIIPFTDEENKAIQEFENMIFELEDERAVKLLLVETRQQYLHDYMELAASRHGSKLHNQYFERLLLISKTLEEQKIVSE